MQRSLFPHRPGSTEGHASVCPRLPQRERVGTAYPDEFWRFRCPECGWVGEPFVVKPTWRERD